MPPVVEQPSRRRISLRFKDGTTKLIHADTIAKPLRTTFYTLKRDGEVVAEYAAEDVSGWCLEDACGDGEDA